MTPTSLAALPLVALLTAAAPASPPALVVEHASAGVCTQGQPFVVAARIAPAEGKKVFDPAVFARPAGTKAYRRLPMLPGSALDTYVATLSADLTSGPVEYYVEAFDVDGAGPFRAGGPTEPLKLAPVQPPPALLATSAGPVAAQPASSSPWDSPKAFAGIAGLALGAVALVGGGVVGGLALQDRSEQQTAATAGDYEAWLRARDATRSKALAADVLYGAGAAVAVAGAALLVWALASGPEAPPARVSVSVGATGSSALAVVHGTFP